MKIKAWVESNVLMCASNQCKIGDRDCPNVNLCKEYEIELKEIEENKQFKTKFDFIKLANKDYGCCSPECIYLNEEFNHCALFSEKLFGVNGFTRCGKCHSIKEKP